MTNTSSNFVLSQILKVLCSLLHKLDLLMLESVRISCISFSFGYTLLQAEILMKKPIQQFSWQTSQIRSIFQQICHYISYIEGGQNVGKFPSKMNNFVRSIVDKISL